MRGWLRRRRRSRQHPTPGQAFEALSQGLCLYAPISKCSGPPRVAGLAHDWDESDVIVCRAHYGRLRKMDSRTAAKLERDLRKAFSKQKVPAAADPERADGVVLVMGRGSDG